MQPKQGNSRPRIVLAGAGHAHLFLMQHRARLADAEVIIIDPGAFWYSGMAAGVLGGARQPSDGRIDPLRLARRYGVGLLRSRLVALDSSQHHVRLQDGSLLGYDLLSLNLGSCVPTLPARPDGPAVWSVKPIQQLVALRRRLEAAFTQSQRPTIAVIGGGASGVELACNLRALAARHGAQVTIHLVCRQSKPLAFAPPGAQSWLVRYLARRGIKMYSGMQAIAHHRDGMLIADYATPERQEEPYLIECEHVVYASGLAPPTTIECLGLPLIEGRGLAIESTLQSVADSDVFATGDCAAMVDHALPRLGVYGVRQAPVLLANLEARLRGLPLHHYTPQPKALTILDLGQGQGLAIRGSLWWAGRLSLRWKRWLDERFMAQYRSRSGARPNQVVSGL